MTNVLPLPTFEVEGYRAIRHLRLPQLERVNLFVGLNNAGKTSLLEAVQLYSTGGSLVEVVEILRARSGYRPTFKAWSGDEPVSEAGIATAFEAAHSLFHGAYSGSITPVRLTSTGGPTSRVEITLPWANSGREEGEDIESGMFADPSTPLVSVTRGERRNDLPIEIFLHSAVSRIRRMGPHVESIPARGLQSFAYLWDGAAESGYATVVEDALRVILPDLDRVYVIGDAGMRRIVLQMGGTTRPVPIANMGDGTGRVFGMALALVAAREGVLLIDEVENGLHHSVQEDVWRTIFELAEKLDVQVFATTHSWDAVVGFQAAANQSSAEGILYRLEREPDGAVYAERYTEEEVAIAADQQVEVR